MEWLNSPYELMIEPAKWLMAIAVFLGIMCVTLIGALVLTVRRGGRGSTMLARLMEYDSVVSQWNSGVGDYWSAGEQRHCGKCGQRMTATKATECPFGWDSRRFDGRKRYRLILTCPDYRTFGPFNNGHRIDMVVDGERVK